MNSPAIDEFAKLVVAWARDQAIRNCDNILHSKGPPRAIKRWKEMARESPEAFASALIPDIVDEAVGNLLLAIDQGVLRLSFTDSKGNVVDLTTIIRDFDSLCGMYQGKEGWCGQYSKERCFDYFPDLDEFTDKPQNEK